MVQNLHASEGMQERRLQSLLSGRSSEVGNDNRLQCSCLQNSVDKGAWQATVPGAAKSRI